MIHNFPNQTFGAYRERQAGNASRSEQGLSVARKNIGVNAGCCGSTVGYRDRCVVPDRGI